MVGVHTLLQWKSSYFEGLYLLKQLVGRDEISRIPFEMPCEDYVRILDAHALCTRSCVERSKGRGGLKAIER